MTIDALKIVAAEMQSLGINYSFIEDRTSQKTYPYFTGEYTESDPMTEDNQHDSTLMLTGYNRSNWMDLEEAKEKIMERFGFEGESFVTDSGSAVVISYGNSTVVPTEDLELKKIQINLNIKEWTVN